MAKRFEMPQGKEKPSPPAKKWLKDVDGWPVESQGDVPQMAERFEKWPVHPSGGIKKSQVLSAGRGVR
jgi:hypothetical protein